MAADVLVEDFLPEDSLYWKILYWKVLLWMILLWMILCFLTSRTISGKRLRFFRRKYYFRKTKRMLFYHQIFWTLSINAPSQPSSRDVWTRPSGQCNSIPTLFPDSKATFFPAVCKLSSWLADEGSDENSHWKMLKLDFPVLNQREFDFELTRIVWLHCWHFKTSGLHKIRTFRLHGRLIRTVCQSAGCFTCYPACCFPCCFPCCFTCCSACPSSSLPAGLFAGPLAGDYFDGMFANTGKRQKKINSMLNLFANLFVSLSSSCSWRSFGFSLQRTPLLVGMNFSSFRKFASSCF